MYFTLEELGLVDCPPEESFDNLTSLAAELLQVPVAHISIADQARKRIYYKSQFGHPDELAQARELPMQLTYCQHVALTGGRVVVTDAREHPLLIGTPAVTEDAPLAYLGIPVKSPGGEIVGGLCMMQPEVRHWTSAEICRAERLAGCVSDLVRLKVSNLVSEQLRREQQTFTYAISHDLRSPANTIGMILEEVKLQGNLLSEDNQMLIDKGIEAVQRMGYQIEDVLSYSQTIGAQTEEERIDLNRMIEEILMDLACDIDPANTAVKNSVCSSIVGNPMQIRALFQNLISNALKFRKPGHQHTVNILSVPSQKGLSILVSDNGIGIEPKHQRKIFDLFQRLNLRKDFEGTGIGLSLCKQVARNHNIAIGIESDGASGTTFSLEFPEQCL